MALATRGGPPGTSKQLPPNETLYINNLPDQLRKEDLKRNLYMLFATYGVVLDVIAVKNAKMRGQAHVVFRNVDTSTQAMRALQGFNFFGSDMKISYAKGKSNTIAKLLGTDYKQREQPREDQVPQSSAAAAVFGSSVAPKKAQPVNAPEEKPPEEEVKGIKRPREEEEEEADEEEDEGAAMDVSDSE